MTAAPRYPVNELFETLQGEGSFTGVPAIFVRLQGCPVGCPWCDTRHTWELKPEAETSIAVVVEKAEADERHAWLSASELLAEVQSRGYHARHLVITGGEPCIYDLRSLSVTFLEAGFAVQLETSGTFEVQIDPRAWVTVSPKVDLPGGYAVRVDALQRANEIKHPVAREAHIEELDLLLAQLADGGAGKVICLQPISQQRRATELAMRTCIERNWRLSAQLHKYLAIP